MSDSLERAWKRVVTEGAVIVLSILIAFAIDAAWEARQERSQIASSLASLADELGGNRRRLGADIDSLRSHIRELEDYVVLVASPSSQVTKEDLRRMWGSLAPLRRFPLQRAAFDDLTSGRMQSIDDGEVRRLILEYGQAMEALTLRQRVAEEWFDRRANPYDEIYGDLVGMYSAAYSEDWAGRGDLRFDFDSSAFLGNRRYGNLLAARYFRSRSILEVREELLEVLIELESMLLRGKQSLVEHEQATAKE